MDLRTNGQTSNIIRVSLKKSADGTPLTGLTSSSSGLIIGTIADNEATTTAYTQAGSTIESITTLGTFAAPTATKCRFKEIDATNHPGDYEIQIADARFAVSNAKKLLVSFSGVATLLATDYEVMLAVVNWFDGVHFGLTAIPNTACTTNASLITSGTGTDQLQVTGGGAAPDWAHVKSPTTTVGLTGTTIATSQVVASITGAVGSVTAAVSITGDLSATMKTSVATAVWTDTTAGDFTVSASIGKSIMNGVSLGTGLKIAECVLTDTLTVYTGNTVQTGDAFACLGVAGVGLTNLGDTRITHLDADISTRTKPADTQAAVTLVTTTSTVTNPVTIATGQVAVKKNTALAHFIFTMTDSTNHNPLAGLTPVVTINKDGAGYTTSVNSPATAIANGNYTIDWAAGDLNANTIAVRITGTAADDLNFLIITQA